MYPLLNRNYISDVHRRLSLPRSERSHGRHVIPMIYLENVRLWYKFGLDKCANLL